VYLVENDDGNQKNTEHSQKSKTAHVNNENIAETAKMGVTIHVGEVTQAQNTNEDKFDCAPFWTSPETVCFPIEFEGAYAKVI
jgi:hypothetical protein